MHQGPLRNKIFNGLNEDLESLVPVSKKYVYDNYMPCCSHSLLRFRKLTLFYFSERNDNFVDCLL